MKVTPARRTFSFQGRSLNDPDPNLSPDEVRVFFAAADASLLTAAVEGPTMVDGALSYTFVRAVREKGQV